MFTTVSEMQQTFAKAVKMISSLLSTEIRAHVIDNGNNEIRGGIGQKGMQEGMRNN